jgi:hypothetical protein
VDDKGAASRLTYSTPQRAAEGVIRAALAARADAALETEVKRKLWASLRRKGWRLEEVVP